MQKTPAVRLSFEVRPKRCSFVLVSLEKKQPSCSHQIVPTCCVYFSIHGCRFLYLGSIVRRFLCDVVDLCSTRDLEEPRSIGAFFLCLVASEYLGSTQSSVSW